jgi:RND superfamily putative drug exporter
MHRQIAGKLTGPVTKWIVLGGALVLLVVMSTLGSKLNDVKNNEASSWLPGSAESTKVADELSKDVNPNDIPTLVVYHRASGLTQADLAEIDKQGQEIAKIKGVTKAGVLTPNLATALKAQGKNVPTLISEDGEVAYTYFVFNFGKGGWNKIPGPADDIRDLTKIKGVDVYLGGYGGQASDFASSFEGSHANLLMFSFLVVIIILLITYRSALLWLLPILGAIVSYQMAGGVVYLLAKYTDMVVNDQSQYILGILVIGAGTDYALLLVARYREELRRHEDRHEAMAVALHRSAPAIIASAATVVIGLMCLAFADLNSTASLGPVLAVGVAVTLLVMVTFLPAMLVICGRWVFGPRTDGRRPWSRAAASMLGGGIVAAVLGGVLGGAGIVLAILGGLSAFLGLLMLVQVGIERWTSVHSRPDFGSVEPTSNGLWAKVGSRIAPRPRAVWAVTATVLALACLGLFKLDAHGLKTEDSFTQTFDSVTAQQLIFAHGLADNSNTVQVVANTDKIDAAEAAVTAVGGIGTPTDIKPLGSTGRSWFEASIKEDVSSPEAFDLVRNARAAAHAVPGADAKVGGGAALYLDTKIASDRDNRVIIPIVLVVVFLILMLLLRALVSPLLLMATVVLSFGAALGLSSLIFRYIFDFKGADPGFPLFAFVFLVALGIDYNIFLMTRVREETMKHGTRKGSLIALSSTGGVITSAGLVLAATFAVLGTLPFVFLAELGTAVALGVLLDTMIVRSVLVTALNLDLGAKIWWPSKLDPGSAAAGPPADPSAEAPEREPASV